MIEIWPFFWQRRATLAQLAPRKAPLPAWPTLPTRPGKANVGHLCANGAAQKLSPTVVSGRKRLRPQPAAMPEQFPVRNRQIAATDMASDFIRESLEQVADVNSECVRKFRQGT